MKGVFKEESGILSPSSAPSEGGGSDFSAQNAPSFDIRRGKGACDKANPPKGGPFPLPPSPQLEGQTREPPRVRLQSRSAPRSHASCSPDLLRGAQPPPAGPRTPRAPSSAEPAPQLSPAPQRSPPAAARASSSQRRARDAAGGRKLRTRPRQPGRPARRALTGQRKPARRRAQRRTPRFPSTAPPPPPPQSAPFVVTGSPGNRRSPTPTRPLPAGRHAAPGPRPSPSSPAPPVPPHQKLYDMTPS